MSAKYLSVFLKYITPMINIIKQAIPEISNNSQLIGALPRIAALAAFITPVIGFIAKIHEYFPAMLAGYITGVTNSIIWMKNGKA